MSKVPYLTVFGQIRAGERITMHGDGQVFIIAEVLGEHLIIYPDTIWWRMWSSIRPVFRWFGMGTR